MLSNSLTTNEVKNSAGAEVEFSRLSIADRETVFSKVGEVYDLPIRLSIGHIEVGSGLKRRRRSKVRFDETSISGVDSSTPVTTSFYLIGDIPVGALTAQTVPANVLAYVLSFCASLGASTTILYDGTGNGGNVLLNGTL